MVIAIITGEIIYKFCVLTVIMIKNMEVENMHKKNLDEIVLNPNCSER